MGCHPHTYVQHFIGVLRVPYHGYTMRPLAHALKPTHFAACYSRGTTLRMPQPINFCTSITAMPAPSTDACPHAPENQPSRIKLIIQP